MEFDIRQFDSYRENNRLEAKKAAGGLPGSLWETYSSMANCYGGVIILGATENEDRSLTATGVADVEALKRDFWNVINNPQKVSVNLLTDHDVETCELDGNAILFNMIGIGERAGSGVPDIYAVWETQGWVAPQVEEQYNPDRTILTLSFAERAAEASNVGKNVGDVGENVGETTAKYENIKASVLKIIAEDNSVSASAIATTLSITQRTVERYIKELREEGSLVRRGPARGGYWEVNDNTKR